MAALTAGRQVRSMPPTCRDDSAGQKGNIIIYAGGMVLLDSSGYATNVNAATKYSPGVALTYRDLDRYDATATGPGGIALADNVNIVRWNEGIFGLDNDTGSPILATTQPGVILFWVDDHTVSLSSSNGSRAVVGRLHHLDGDLQVYVSMSKVIGRQAMEEIYGSSLGETIGPGAITLTGLTSLTPAAQTTGSPAYLTVTRALGTVLSA